MKWSILGLFALGIVAALGATGMVVSLQSAQETIVTESPSTPEVEDPEVEILTVARDMEPREVVGSEDIAIQTIRKSLMPEASFFDPVQVVGKVLVVPVKQGQAFAPSCFANEGSGFHLASALKGGKRAVSLVLSDDMGLENLLYPGCVVDVITTMKVAHELDGSEQPVSITLLNSVMILAVGDRTIVASASDEKEAGSNGRRDRPSVTLLVEPVEAEMLKLAMEQGSVSLTMRNPMDDEIRSPNGTRLTTLSPFLAAAEQRARERWLEKQRFERERLELERQKLDRDRQAVAKATTEIQEEEPEPQVWETLILRGGEAETKTFAGTSDQRRP